MCAYCVGERACVCMRACVGVCVYVCAATIMVEQTLRQRGSHNDNKSNEPNCTFRENCRCCQKYDIVSTNSEA